MRLVYIISAYKLPDMLIRLVNRLQADDVTFLIHIDKKTSPEISGRMETGLNHFDNVFFLERHVCYWGDFGHVRATLKGIKEIVERAIPCDYAILLTGQDYPLKTNRAIKDFFRQYSGQSFISYTSLPHEKWNVMGRIECWHYWIWRKHVRFPMNTKGGRFISIKKLINLLLPSKRKFPPGMKPYGGSSYWNLTEESICYIWDYVRNNPDFLDYFHSTYVSDEFFFQTLLLNSLLRTKIVNNHLRHIDWSGRDGVYPTIFKQSDFDTLRVSPHLFARKFDPTVDSRILDMIDQHLLVDEVLSSIEN